MSSVGLLVSLVCVCGISIGLLYTKKYISYLEAHPIYHPSKPGRFQPDGGVEGCLVLNHTYFYDSAMGEPMINVFAKISTNSLSECKQNQIIKFWAEFFQSCRCHNASQVNRTIDQDFPIGKNISCCVNGDCSAFNNVCKPRGSWTEPSPDISDYEYYYGLQWFIFAVGLLFVIGFFIAFVIDKVKKRNYQSVDEQKTIE